MGKEAGQCDRHSAPLRIALGLGANLGDPVANLQSAVAKLCSGGLHVCRLAYLYETEPVDCEPGTPPFVNSALIGEWTSGIRDLYQLCKRIEVALGRPAQHSSRAARAVDIDILLADGLVIDTAELTIPHAQIRSRLFVLIPLNDVVPEWEMPPDGKTVSQALSELMRQCGEEASKAVRKLPVSFKRPR